MKKFTLVFSIVCITVGIFAILDAFEVKPEKYRNWHHMKSMIIF